MTMSKNEDRQDGQPVPKTEAAAVPDSQELSPESLDGVVGGLMAAVPTVSATTSLRSTATPVCISQS
jgi:hypothetical protein